MEIMSADISKLAEALSKMQGSTPAIPKNKSVTVPLKDNKKYSYSYADLAGIWEAIRPSMSQNGLSISQTFVEQDDHIQLITVLFHSSGQWIKSYLKIITNGLRIQDIGSAMTYNRRYALSAILGLSTDDDEDGALANEHARTKKEATKQPVAQVQEPETPQDIISVEEAVDLENMLAMEEPIYREDLLKYFSNVTKTEYKNFFGLPRKHYDAAIRSVKRRREEKFKKKQPDEQIPF
jgi:hypothetical protein